jgi:hypothetical protein
VPAVAEDELLALEEDTGESDDVIGDEGGWMNLIEQKAAEKKIIVIAGPNGAGKTTFAGEFLPKEAHCPAFVNADLIAAGLAPFDPERAAFRAGRLMLEEIHSHVRRGASFAFETTLSGRGYAALLPRWQGTERDPDLAAAEIAMKRAAVKARQKARQAGVGVVVWKDGRIVEERQNSSADE